MAIQEKRSRLAISEIDRDQMRSWIDRAVERAGDYEVRFYRTPMPDDVIVNYCELQFQMNTAPLDDYEEDDLVVTPQIWRDLEEKADAAMTDINTYVAVHKPTDRRVRGVDVHRN